MRHAIRATLLLVVGHVGLATAAESSVSGTSIENAFRGAIQDRSSKTADEALFVEKCSMCHRQMGMGTVSLARRVPSERAMLEKRTDLTVDFVKVIARRGLINMPRISRVEVDDDQLDRIARYLAKGNSP
ncbi:MAG: cytochrome c [Proteobacteria bacterium]|jgi:hypothetical protein|nr:cytochrome c [Pseudomonadota bacterium]